MGKYKEIRWKFSEYKWIANNVERWWKLRCNEAQKKPEVKESPEFRASEELVDRYKGTTQEFKEPDYCVGILCTRPQLQVMNRICQEQRWSLQHGIVPEYYRRIDKKPELADKFAPYIERAEQRAAMLKEMCNKLDVILGN